MLLGRTGRTERTRVIGHQEGKKMADEILKLIDGLWSRYVEAVTVMISTPMSRVALCLVLASVIELEIAFFILIARGFYQRVRLDFLRHRYEIQRYTNALETITPQLQTKTAVKPPMPDLLRYTTDDNPAGYVYLIKAPNGHYKIGIAKNPETRLAELQTAHSGRLMLECAIPSSDPRQAEHALHVKYADKRTTGVWFALMESDVADIKAVLEHAEVDDAVVESEKSRITIGVSAKAVSG